MPVDIQTRSRQPGFQGSETSSAELTIYPSGQDSIIKRELKTIEFRGQYITDQQPALVSVSTRKSLNGGGSWSAVIKDGTPFARDVDLRDQIVDDDWADIVFKRHNRPFHVMRGLVEKIQRSRTVGGSGATSVTYTITGRDFGWIWEKTPLWFNKFISPGNPLENVVGATAMQVFDSINIGGSVAETVRAFLRGFLEALGETGRANWKMPKGMPNVANDSSFIKNVVEEFTGFKDDPPRLSINPNFMDPNGAGAWAMAQEWSDPAFCELWYDLGVINPDFINPSGTTGTSELPTLLTQLVDAQQPITESKMVLFLRDRPFPTVAKGHKSPWFSLPTIEVQREDIVSDELTRGGAERFNAYFLSPQLTQEATGNSAIEITDPMWDTKDMLTHGFRRFDIMSKYRANFLEVAARDTALLTLTKAQRTKIRDWYAINPYLYSGTISLGHGRPDARVGMRVRIPHQSQERTETYYLEEVSHTWTFGPGIRTNLGVTRGWIGTDDSYMHSLSILGARYSSGIEAVAPTVGFA